MLPLVFWSFVIALPSSSFGTEEGALAEATRALQRGDYARAQSLAATYVKVHPAALAARILLARAEIARRELPSAFWELRKILRADPKNLDALYYLGRVSEVLSRSEYERLYALAPNSARVHQLLAESYLAQEKPSQAEEEYQAALDANPESVEVLDALGELKRSRYRFDDAIAYYSRAAALAPRDYTSAYGLGASYLYKQEPERAVDFFRKALAIDHVSAATRLALGDALLRAGKPAEAVEELKDAVALEPDMRQAYTLLARAYQKLGRTEDADEALKRSQELTRKESEARRALLGSEEGASDSPGRTDTGENPVPKP